MVSDLSIMGMIFSVFIAILVPVGLSIILYVRFRYQISFLLVGILAFVISQGIRTALLLLFSSAEWYRYLSGNLLFAIFIGGVTAGLFEESARYGGFHIQKKKQPQWADAVAFGIGHGGIEAILLVGLSQVSNLVLGYMINSGMFDTQIAPALGDQADIIRNQLVETSPELFFISGMERISAISLHVFLSVLVCLSVKNKKPLLLLLAVVLHTVFNTPAVFYSFGYLNIYVVEGLLALVGGLMLIGTICLQPRLDKQVNEMQAE